MWESSDDWEVSSLIPQQVLQALGNQVGLGVEPGIGQSLCLWIRVSLCKTARGWMRRPLQAPPAQEDPTVQICRFPTGCVLRGSQSSERHPTPDTVDTTLAQAPLWATPGLEELHSDLAPSMSHTLGDLAPSMSHTKDTWSCHRKVHPSITLSLRTSGVHITCQVLRWILRIQMGRPRHCA